MMPTPDDHDRYLNLNQLAQYAGLSVNTLTRHMKAPERPLPHYRIGGRIVVLKSEYDAWVRQTSNDQQTKDQTYAAKVAAAALSLRRRR